ncbi:P80 family lipoprotein [Mycoplasma zalophi]|uniref:P80 family lipoprotein n=1 Tax=Mycoplasma zalophi TaxID=191287 RepID=A0ABS6DPR4_9MOLU|nr:P80 family lipoprotein [Mycoplasma zalophi]MBU4692151.1 P80 family lipoprotein [Mycoplasma zalophi]
MRKHKKILSVIAGLGLTTLLAAPLLAASCTKETRFDQDNDGKIKILSSWSETNKQGIALKAVVEKYNESQKNEPGFMPVEIITSAKGYSDNEWEAKLAAKDTSTFFNLMINYPTVASKVAKYDMNLSFNSIKTEIDNVFSTEFTAINSSIAGNKNGEYLVIPTTRSGEMNSIDKALFGKFLKELQDNGASIAEDSKEWANEFINQYTNAQFKAEHDYIDSEWASGKTTGNDLETAKSAIKGYVISKTMLDNYVDLLKFATLAKSLYANNNNYVVGLDSFPNATFVMAASLNNSADGSLVVKDDNNQRDGGFDFNALTTPGTKEYQRLEEIYNAIKQAIATKALFIGGSGSFGSSTLTTHKMAMSIGSTAGYAYNFVKGAKVTFDFNKDLGIKGSIQYANLLGQKNASKADSIFTLKDGSGHINNLYARPLTAADGKYDVGTEAGDTATVEKLNTLTENSVGGVLTSDNKLKEENGKVVYKVSKDESIILEGAIKIGKLGQNGKKFYDYFFLPTSLVNVVDLPKEKTLQENEAAFLNAPSKFNKDSTTNQFTLQGPSIIGVHANTDEDKSTTQFIKWLLTNKTETIEIPESKTSTKTYTNQTPIEVLADFGSYVVLSKDLLAKDPQTLKLNTANTLLFKNLQAISNEPTVNKIVEDVAAPKSQTLRNALESASRAAFDKAVQNQDFTFEQFVSKIKETLK